MTTQKPWKIDDRADDKNGYIAIRGPNDEKIADIFPFAGVGGVGIKEARENAVLIVALANEAPRASALFEVKQYPGGFNNDLPLR